MTMIVAVAAIASDDDEFGANRVRAMQAYADAMGWTSHVYEPAELADAVATRSVQLVLCWRLTDLPGADGLLAACHAADVAVLPLAQSCSALAE